MPAFGQPKNSAAVVSCGKNGDLLNILPILKHLHDTNRPHDLVHCGLFTNVLLGVTYTHRVQTRFSPNDADKAVAWAQTRYTTVLRLHEFGKGYDGPHDIAHNARQWLKAGLTVANFHDLAGFPLVFDRRCSDREDFLYRTHVKTTKPLLAHFLSCSSSSPFAGHHVLKESLKRTWASHYEVLDLCRIKCPRLFDLLVILQKAAALVTADGSVLHLAAAVPSLPVIVLLGDNPLTAAEPRFKPVLRLGYLEAVRRTREIHAAIGKILTARRNG